jgi:hypothetical protein
MERTATMDLNTTPTILLYLKAISGVDESVLLGDGLALESKVAVGGGIGDQGEDVAKGIIWGFAVYSKTHESIQPGCSTRFKTRGHVRATIDLGTQGLTRDIEPGVSGVRCCGMCALFLSPLYPCV